MQHKESSKAYFHTNPKIRWSYKDDECKNTILTLQIIFYIENYIHMKGSVFTEAYKRTPVLQNLPLAASSAKSLDSFNSATASPYK